MDDCTENTPTKTITRLTVQRISRESACIICDVDITNSDNKRKLFIDSIKKTTACINLEFVLGHDISHELSNSCRPICRNCSDKNATLVKKITEVRSKYSAVKEKILAEGEVEISESNKRMCKDYGQDKTKIRPVIGSSRELFPDGLKEASCSSEENRLSEEMEETAVSITVNFPNTQSRKRNLTEKYVRLGRQLAFGDSKSIALAVINVPELKIEVVNAICKQVTKEISGLCSKSNPSLLRSKIKEQLENFSWEKLHEEIDARAPLFLKFLEASISNSSHSRNKNKRPETLLPPMLHAGCELVSIFNQDMSAVRKIISVILKKGGLKKVAFMRLSPLFVCMGYKATTTLLHEFGKQFDKELLRWKDEVEKGERKEMELLCDVQIRETQNDPRLKEAQLALENCRAIMHPGYSFTGDNVDMRVVPRHMTVKSKTKDHHMYQLVAFKNRVSCNHLPAENCNRDITVEPFTTFLPHADEQMKLVEELVVLVGHKWADYLPELSWYKHFLPKCIQHEKMEETKKKTEKVHLGVLMKNEQKEDDMIDILEWLHKYVPGHSESNTQPSKVISGGDYLTFERHQGAQSSMQDARTPSSRLEGFIPKFEDFHMQAELLKVIWYHLYNNKSSRDKGTLYAARNTLDERKVCEDPHNNFYACGEFLDKVLDAYLIVGAMQHHGMQSIEDSPTENVYEGREVDVEKKRLHVHGVIKSFVEEHVVNQVPELSQIAPVSNAMVCRFCGKKYVQRTALQNHEKNKHDFTIPDAEKSNNENAEEDRVYNYTHTTLVLLLLRLNHEDAIKYGDGERILRLYKLFCLFFKVSKCPKYAFATLHLQAQVKCLLSPRLAHSITWNRFVNTKGKIDTNYPMDLAVEHDNKTFKTDIHSYRGEITEKSITRVSRSLEATEDIIRSFDKSCGIHKPSGKHTRLSMNEDVKILVDQFLEGSLYKKINGRKHNSFPNIKHNILDEIDSDKLKSWVSNSLKKFSKKHFYK